jgi:phage gp46-like protein
MEMLIDPTTGDYTGDSSESLANAVYLRLMTPLGSWWADPTLGSLLHTLRERMCPAFRTAVQYSQQALQPIIDDGRAQSISVTAEHWQKGWMLLHITVTCPRAERRRPGNIRLRSADAIHYQKCRANSHRHSAGYQNLLQLSDDKLGPDSDQSVRASSVPALPRDLSASGMDSPSDISGYS